MNSLRCWKKRQAMSHRHCIGRYGSCCAVGIRCNTSRFYIPTAQQISVRCLATANKCTRCAENLEGSQRMQDRRNFLKTSAPHPLKKTYRLTPLQSNLSRWTVPFNAVYFEWQSRHSVREWCKVQQNKCFPMIRILLQNWNMRACWPCMCLACNQGYLVVSSGEILLLTK